MMQAYQLIEEAGYSIGEVREFMIRLRDSGQVNMMGAGLYLNQEFGFDRREQKEIVLQWFEDGLSDTEEV